MKFGDTKIFFPKTFYKKSSNIISVLIKKSNEIFRRGKRHLHLGEIVTKWQNRKERQSLIFHAIRMILERAIISISIRGTGNTNWKQFIAIII